jgi:hypothetical protein
MLKGLPFCFGRSSDARRNLLIRPHVPVNVSGATFPVRSGNLQCGVRTRMRERTGCPTCTPSAHRIAARVRSGSRPLSCSSLFDMYHSSIMDQLRVRSSYGFFAR